MRLGLAVLAAVCACRGKPPALYPAGDTRDDGHGLLAQASTQFMTEEETDALLEDNPRRRAAYGGNAYGGAAYGGSGYAGYVVPAWPVTAPNRTPRYNVVQGLTGAIEGTIALRGAILSTACGEVAAPKVALVYIEKVQVGRALMNDGRPASVGGTLVKRGCALAPTVQIVTPLPAAVTIQGDAKPARVKVAAKTIELQAGGRAAHQLVAGVTKFELEGGNSAWIVALDTPYYAVTDDRGRFRMDELAAGTYDVIVWQPPVGKLVNGTIAYGEPTVTKRSVRVEDRRTARLDVR